MQFPNINPVAFSIGSFPIYWYAISYVAGIVIGYFYIKDVNKNFQNPIPKDLLENLSFNWIVIGIIVGGRLGYILFYEPHYITEDPIKILAIRDGGMSFHGGLIGVAVACIAFSKIHKLNFLYLMDLIASAVPIGLGLGRIGNFINGEHFGSITTLPWGMIFPKGGQYPRHPSQLYEAFLEGLVLFFVIYFARKMSKKPIPVGRLSGVFGIGYAIARICVEFVREIDTATNYSFFQMTNITLGQALSLPILIAGIFLYRRSRNGV